ncbi:TolB-like translocation protein [Microlunatus antarcticus]|uniref:WD40-like Beta Propeller Repeat n=1 Tax=Microlunatus antarcticus TaxID=53388 RepID=A0A7W5JY69_9ACTN|nr:PD40 domain-containing protein [Microlunatus antarcticus]MBB3328499.1 hypothetical protein [Microlunatus antarcticus]
MTRWWRWTVALVLCGPAVWLGLTPTAAAAPAPEVGVGRVVADLGLAVADGRPGFSPGGGYYAYLAHAGDRCDLRLYDVAGHRPVDLQHARVVCDAALPRWADAADTISWQVNAAAGDITVYAWDAGTGQVTVLAPDAHVFGRSAYEIAPALSADGQLLAFTGRSDSRPAPPVDRARTAGYVYDRRTGVSLPLSRTDVHVDFQTWAPKGQNFTARAGGWNWDTGTGACFGSGTSCRVVPDLYIDFGAQWSRDGVAVIANPGPGQVYDFSTGTFDALPAEAGRPAYMLFLGRDSRRVLGYKDGGGGLLWDRRTDQVTQITSVNAPHASKDGRWVLFQSAAAQTYRYLDVSNGAVATATYRDTSNRFVRGGAWVDDSTAYVGVGPGGCSSLRQWSPATNTVSLFGPPPPRGCYSGPGDEGSGRNSSASGRFTGAAICYPFGRGCESYLVDLRRHVLLGPLVLGQGSQWAPVGSDLLVARQSLGFDTARVLLVDPTPTPDVDDKPRWSVATPASGSRVEATVGEQVTLQPGAWDLQGTPVNLYFRWRDANGVPIASAPKGWSCERRRLAGGGTVADCTFAPPRDPTATRFVDVWSVNYVTGAQSDTRSYRVGVRT